ncbi:PilZ domain-containing protein [Erythrobacter sp. THAF29]|uniref:PilZ domain-containing protein n=1 Tax=Erythrobacter sp. THAF29 TaxID=2587851 RepID=UPI0012694DDF|nr:PilZ domain-containing protein [Erythrobacter sp. THAF29]QFT76125.1 PilZ domain protein [Erythrobacter sp. THAF29]
MSGLETRTVSRDSLFQLAQVQVEQDEEAHKVRVRNLSDGGMMGEGNIRVQRGNRLKIELRNVGTVEGSVAWVQDNRFGIAFDEEIDSQLARKPAGTTSPPDAQTLERSWRYRAPTPPDPTSLRKI